ncbi:MAG: DNA polymerase III subunit epsilon [Zoogloeaceae bacterium]|jgi:DNA polymerase-3 subunit epsilon|nr:DNA polymerase III subunit epsilon [Zoogloeaceae bacterium]
MKRRIFLDTETTGMNPAAGDRVLEVAAVEVAGRHPTGKKLHWTIDPERDVPEEVSRIHGHTNASLRGSPVFARIGQELHDFLQGAEFFAHNAPFDVGFIDMEFARMGLPPVRETCTEIVDTLALARKKHPGQKNSLDALCDRYEIDRSGRSFHGALLDTNLLIEVWRAMTRKQDALFSEADRIATTLARQPRPAGSRKLIVKKATEAENAAHEKIMAEIRQ